MFKLPDADDAAVGEDTPLLGGKGDTHTSESWRTGLKEAWVRFGIFLAIAH
jgi:hypothetical protein